MGDFGREEGCRSALSGNLVAPTGGSRNWSGVRLEGGELNWSMLALELLAPHLLSLVNGRQDRRPGITAAWFVSKALCHGALRQGVISQQRRVLPQRGCREEHTWHATAIT
jgi:hypothetical protein